MLTNAACLFLAATENPPPRLPRVCNGPMELPEANIPPSCALARSVLACRPLKEQGEKASSEVLPTNSYTIMR